LLKADALNTLLTEPANDRMTSKAKPPAASSERRQKLTDEIRKQALGARSDGLHPVRVRHAVRCGKALAKLKKLLDHGDWSRWVEERCAVNRMTANRYIRLASRADLLTPDMTIREAYIAVGVITPKPQSGSKRRRERSGRNE
jgi:Protein of unknown function (DUF3102)